MRIALLQTDICEGDVEGNLRRAEGLVMSNRGADFYVLPEMFGSGFVECPSEVDVRSGERVVGWMRELAVRVGGGIGGSVLVGECGRVYNRFVVALGDGGVRVSDKRHLFSMGGEGRSYSAGGGRVVVTVGGVRFLLLVCYDLRFPVWSRQSVDVGYDAIVYVANWPATRMMSWDTLLRARAIENQSYVVGVNRVGRAGNISYVGHSVVYDAWGNEVVRCGDGEVSVVEAELRSERVAEVRRKFPALMDADEFCIVAKPCF